MRIESVTDIEIRFDNGNVITFDHEQDCCECNWADFSILTPNTVNYYYDFDEDLTFEFVEGLGFIFGSMDENELQHMIFIPCYSDQNSYYSTDIDIYYNDHKVLNGNCYERID